MVTHLEGSEFAELFQRLILVTKSGRNHLRGTLKLCSLVVHHVLEIVIPAMIWTFDGDWRQRDLVVTKVPLRSHIRIFNPNVLLINVFGWPKFEVPTCECRYH